MFAHKAVFECANDCEIDYCDTLAAGTHIGKCMIAMSHDDAECTSVNCIGPQKEPAAFEVQPQQHISAPTTGNFTCRSVEPCIRNIHPETMP